MQLTSVAPAAAALLSALLIQTTVAADDTAFITALPHAGAATSDVYPPEGSM